MARSQTIRIFVVEDDPVYQRLVKYIVEMDSDHEVHAFETGAACLANLNLQPDIISLDYSLPDMTGEEVLGQIKAYNPEIGVVILSGQQDISTAVKLLKAGATDYIIKDTETKERLLNSLANHREKILLRREVDLLKVELDKRYDVSKQLIGESPDMIKVFNLIEKAVKSDINVSLEGESGTGKEVVAKCIHHNSSRKHGPFIALNMSAIPRELVESELFGHEKGAFTGALSRKKGQFELSDGGTLFLDEISEIDINIQAKLLRALQEREFRRVGGEQSIKFDARVIVASHKNLAEEIKQGHFREDLYFRLLGLNIKLPPLRERGNDILLLTRSFLNNIAQKQGLKKLDISSTAKKKLLNYSFPGNVRELMAIIELGAVMAEGHMLDDEHIQFNRISRAEDLLHLDLTMEEYKEYIIKAMLEKYQNQVSLVAEKLNIGKSTIYRLLQSDK